MLDARAKLCAHGDTNTDGTGERTTGGPDDNEPWRCLVLPLSVSTTVVPTAVRGEKLPITPVTLSARPLKNSTPRLPTETETAGDGDAGSGGDTICRRSRLNVIKEVTLLDRSRIVFVDNVGESRRG